MKIKTSELVDRALNYAVATAEGYPVTLNPSSGGWQERGWWQCGPNCWKPLCDYSTDWSQGGPIIEREKLSIWFSSEKGGWLAVDIKWLDADVDSDEFCSMSDPYCGASGLIAAMRCFVASHFGDEVEIPEEILS